MHKISEEVILKSIKMLSDGMTLIEIGLFFNHHPSVLSKKMRKKGAKTDMNWHIKTPYNRLILDINMIIDLYNNGESENSISKRLNVSRQAIRNRLIENNIHIRTQSEAEKLKWSKMDGIARKNQVKKAHEATIGDKCHLYKDGRANDVEYKKKYRQVNREKLAECRKAYFQTQNGKAVRKNSKHKRRTITKQGDVTTQQLLELQSSAKVCYWCGVSLKGKKVHIDHYVPLSKGGEHTLSNLVVSCASCNLSKHAKDPLVFAHSVGKLF